MDRREFASKLPLAMAAATFVESAGAQAVPGAKPAAALKTLTSGTFKPAPAKPSNNGRSSRQYLLGMLKAGNIRLEMHETMQVEGAEHEPVGTHLHNEIWCVQHGTATLYINGVEHTMEAGDVGLVCAGDEHWIKNAGPGELAYFVITVGPPE